MSCYLGLHCLPLNNCVVILQLYNSTVVSVLILECSPAAECGSETTALMSSVRTQHSLDPDGSICYSGNVSRTHCMLDTIKGGGAVRVK